MALTFREQVEATAWELGNGEGTMPEGGWISNRSGRNNRNIYASVRPYRQMDDPKSDAFVDRMSREEASELDKENPLEI